MLSLDDADVRSPSRIRGMFQVMWLIARDTSWYSSTDFGMKVSFEFGRKKSDLSWGRVAMVVGVLDGRVLGYFKEI